LTAEIATGDENGNNLDKNSAKCKNEKVGI
jgi:hypothetical protein